MQQTIGSLGFLVYFQNYHGSQSLEMLLSAFKCFEGLESYEVFECLDELES